MALKVGIFTQKFSTACQWKEELENLLGPYLEVQISIEEKDASFFLIEEEVLNQKKIIPSHSQCILVVVTQNSKTLPVAYLNHQVDDVVSFPFSLTEIISKICFFHQFLILKESKEWHVPFLQTIESLKNTLEIAQRIQAKVHPRRFPKIQGLELESGYVAGLKSGDYFDLFRDLSQRYLAVVFCSAKQYSTANLFLSLIMKWAHHLSQVHLNQSIPVQEFLFEILNQLKTELGEKKEYSFFYGLFNLNNLQLDYIHIGENIVAYTPSEMEIKWLPSVISVQLACIQTLKILPGSRLIFGSLGLIQELGEKKWHYLIEKKRKSKLFYFANEVMYQLKSNELKNPYPLFDCSLLAMEIKAEVLHLA